MATPITICDDSKFARNQVKRALPANWDVSVHFACNGAEALDAIEQELAEVLFLDLTMPVMDGIDVLEQLAALGAETRVIVISADIQPAMRERVHKLGAIAFLQKPIDENRLIQVLNQQGIYAGEASQHQLSAQKTERNDWLAETINVSMGNAADRLARTLGFEITLSIPHVSELESSDIQMLLTSSQSRSQEPLITQGFIGQGVAGECVLYVEVLDDESSCDLLRARYDKANLQTILYDLASILNGSLLKRMFSQIGSHFHISPPVALRHYDKTLALFSQDADRGRKLLAVEICYKLGSESLSCNQVIIFTHDACQKFDTLLRTI